MTNLTKCILTDFAFGDKVKFIPTNENAIRYQFEPVGEVIVCKYVLIQIENHPIENKWILAGLCRNAYENKIKPPLIDSEFLKNFSSEVDYPKTFQEKVQVLLNYIYNSGGKDYKPKNFHSAMDYTLAFAESEDEFTRIMEYCEGHSYINWRNCNDLSRGRTIYNHVLLTDLGIEEVLKDLPNIPMIGLVDQEIITGNPNVDIKINKAKKMFFDENSGMEEKRNACETLSFVLEAYRTDLEEFFARADISDFFNIVNRFDIRHNKDRTIQLKHEEQLEWIFYSLLNTINTYVKLKRTINEPDFS